MRFLVEHRGCGPLTLGEAVSWGPLRKARRYSDGGDAVWRGSRVGKRVLEVLAG
jgi:hypothetical protein